MDFEPLELDEMNSNSRFFTFDKSRKSRGGDAKELAANEPSPGGIQAVLISLGAIIAILLCLVCCFKLCIPRAQAQFQKCKRKSQEKRRDKARLMAMSSKDHQEAPIVTLVDNPTCKQCKTTVHMDRLTMDNIKSVAAKNKTDVSSLIKDVDKCMTCSERVCPGSLRNTPSIRNMIKNVHVNYTPCACRLESKDVLGVRKTNSLPIKTSNVGDKINKTVSKRSNECVSPLTNIIMEQIGSTFRCMNIQVSSSFKFDKNKAATGAIAATNTDRAISKETITQTDVGNVVQGSIVNNNILATTSAENGKRTERDSEATELIEVITAPRYTTPIQESTKVNDAVTIDTGLLHYQHKLFWAGNTIAAAGNILDKLLDDNYDATNPILKKDAKPIKPLVFPEDVKPKEMGYPANNSVEDITDNRDIGQLYQCMDGPISDTNSYTNPNPSIETIETETKTWNEILLNRKKYGYTSASLVTLKSIKSGGVLEKHTTDIDTAERYDNPIISSTIEEIESPNVDFTHSPFIHASFPETENMGAFSKGLNISSQNIPSSLLASLSNDLNFPHFAEVVTLDENVITTEFIKDMMTDIISKLNTIGVTNKSITAMGSVHSFSTDVSKDDDSASNVKDIGIRVIPSVHFTSDSDDSTERDSQRSLNSTYKHSVNEYFPHTETEKYISTAKEINTTESEETESINKPNLKRSLEEKSSREFELTDNEKKRKLRKVSTTPMHSSSVRFQCPDDNIDVDDKKVNNKKNHMHLNITLGKNKSEEYSEVEHNSTRNSSKDIPLIEITNIKPSTMPSLDTTANSDSVNDPSVNSLSVATNDCSSVTPSNALNITKVSNIFSSNEELVDVSNYTLCNDTSQTAETCSVDTTVPKTNSEIKDASSSQFEDGANSNNIVTDSITKSPNTSLDVTKASSATTLEVIECSENALTIKESKSISKNSKLVNESVEMKRNSISLGDISDLQAKRLDVKKHDKLTKSTPETNIELKLMIDVNKLVSSLKKNINKEKK